MCHPKWVHTHQQTIKYVHIEKKGSPPKMIRTHTGAHTTKSVPTKLPSPDQQNVALHKSIQIEYSINISTLKNYQHPNIPVYLA